MVVELKIRSQLVEDFESTRSAKKKIVAGHLSFPEKVDIFE